MGVLGVLVIYIGFLTTPQALAGLVLVALGIVFVAMTWMQFKVTEGHLELTENELRVAGGRVLAEVSNISGVERGPFAFKPSQGFLIKMKAPQPRAWAPGLYWRFGRLLGIGGVTSASQGKFMADTLQALIASRADQG